MSELISLWISVFQLPLISMAVLQSLVAIWAATSRKHWFLRALAVWAALSLLLPIEAWDPAWLCALSSTTIISVLLFWRLRNERQLRAAEPGPPRSRIRFGLLDLFLLMLLIGLSLATLLPVVRHYRPSNYLGWFVGGSAIAAITLLTFFSNVGKRPWRAALLLLFVLLAQALATAIAGDINWSPGIVWPIDLREIGAKLVQG